MATIKEDYVSFEVAKLLKEKGFDEYCSKSYFKMDKTLKESGFSEWEKVNEIKAPTQSLAIKWLREVHNIFIEIGTSIDLNGNYHFSYTILDNECKYIRRGYSDFDWNYEEAAETAIKYCLENLI